MKKIVISPYPRKLRNGERSAKEYPYWEKLISSLRSSGYYIIQIGQGEENKLGADEYAFDLPLDELEKFVIKCDGFISVDNFFQHFCAMLGKRAIVLFGKSDPEIFGHNENINLLKDRKHLRLNQFEIWEIEKYEKECFVSPEVVLEKVKQFSHDRSYRASCDDLHEIAGS